jgi:hypothetical protein
MLPLLAYVSGYWHSQTPDGIKMELIQKLNRIGHLPQKRFKLCSIKRAANGSPSHYTTKRHYAAGAVLRLL